MIKVILSLLIALAISAPVADLVDKVPGFPDNYAHKVYSGYLQTNNSTRKLHYIFVESQNDTSNKHPVTLWLNGGPGCSSMMGFIQQIGPYFMQQGKNYTQGDIFTENKYSWNKLSHLLFIQSPAGVGYSVNSDPTFSHSDLTTANDNLNALKDFFVKFPEYADRNFWISGQSYAGKYIPDLALRIVGYNRQTGAKKINLKGMLIGNGVMDFTNGALGYNGIDYMVDHDFIDPEIIHYYENSCKNDEFSAGCRYFNSKYLKDIDQLNPYNVYSYCFYNDSFLAGENGEQKQFLSQQTILKNLGKANRTTFDAQDKYNGAPCQYFDGMLTYFNKYKDKFHADQLWDGPCSQKVLAKYTIGLSGSMNQYRYLLPQNLHILLYNGDWDSVVPYTDTLANLQKLDLKIVNKIQPFFVNDQHAGFMYLFSGGVQFVIVKGASHMVPQTKRAQALHLFESILGAASNSESDQ